MGGGEEEDAEEAEEKGVSGWGGGGGGGYLDHLITKDGRANRLDEQAEDIGGLKNLLKGSELFVRKLNEIEFAVVPSLRGGERVCFKVAHVPEEIQ